MSALFNRVLRRLGRSLEPLLAPDAEAQRARLDRLTEQSRDQQRLVKTLASDVAASRAEIRKLLESRRDETAEMQGRFADLRGAVRRHEAALRRLARRGGIEAELEITEQRVIDRLDRMRRSSQPIVIGPWTGEIGFELLYWAPFVRWAVEKFNLPSERLVIVSRGGVTSWYGLPNSRYVDVFSVATPDEFRSRTETTKKQRTVTAFDRDIARRVRTALGGGAVQLLHPALMYALFMPFWKDQAPVRRVFDHVRYRRIEPPRPIGLPALPAKYVAVRFYFSNCFPDTADNRAFVARVIEALSEHHDVVMLNPGFRPDDHMDYVAASHPRIHVFDMSAHAGENLAWQSAIIAGAQAFVGTYGGFAYLAPFCGVRSIAFYSDRNYFTYHLTHAQRAFAAIGSEALEAIDVGTVSLLDGVLDGVPSGYRAMPRKAAARVEEAAAYDYLWHKASKRLDIRSVEGFGPLAAATVAEHRTGMREDRLYTLWQAISALPAGAHPIAEVGVYRGGSARFIGEALRFHGKANPFFVCDTFQGHVAVDEELDGDHRTGVQFTDTSVDDVERYLADLPNIRVISGDFQQTSAQLEAHGPFALAHLDVDVYPIMCHALNFFARRLLPAGLIIVDDYGFNTCIGSRKAVDEFAAAHGDFRKLHLLTGQAVLVRVC
jgi:hypothetical protein